jgi:hypothetical protein
MLIKNSTEIGTVDKYLLWQGKQLGWLREIDNNWPRNLENDAGPLLARGTVRGQRSDELHQWKGVVLLFLHDL